MKRFPFGVALAWIGGACVVSPTVPVTPVGAVRSSLRAVATAQERYVSDHGTYAADVASLRRYPGCPIHSGVTITIHAASAHGWAASASHPGFPDRTCVQWVSRPGEIPVPVTLHDGRRGDEEPGGVVCDAEPQAARRSTTRTRFPRPLRFLPAHPILPVRAAFVPPVAVPGRAAGPRGGGR